MEKCQKCESDRVVFFSAKCSDLFFSRYKGKEHNGYVNLPDHLQDYGDYVDIDLCLECGQVQGKFPMKTKEYK